MKIGVLSDTHLAVPTGKFHAVTQKIRNKRTIEDLHEIVQQHLSDVELILHAGDFVEEAVFEMLQKFAPVKAVRGNMDHIAIQNRFPTCRIVEVNDFKIGLTHGDGPPQGIVERVKQHFHDVDAIVFGHSHQPLNEKHDGILFFNPGSPTDRIFAPYTSIGMLEVSDTITGRLIKL